MYLAGWLFILPLYVWQDGLLISNWITLSIPCNDAVSFVHCSLKIISRGGMLIPCVYIWSTEILLMWIDADIAYFSRQLNFSEGYGDVCWCCPIRIQKIIRWSNASNIMQSWRNNMQTYSMRSIFWISLQWQWVIVTLVFELKKL